MRVFQENSFYDLAYRRFRRNKLAIVGAAITLVFVFIAIFAPVLTPYGPSEFFFADDGARVTIIVAFSAVLISTIIGALVGLVSGYFGKLLDSVLMRIVDVVISFP